MLAFPLIFLCFLFGSNSQSCTGLTRFNLQGNLLRYYQINDDVLMYLDDRGNVYRTTDGLQTFTQLTTTQLPTSDIAQSLTSSVLPRRIVDGITTSDPNVMYFYGGGGRLWRTNDGGATFTFLTTGFEILWTSSEKHSTNSQMLLLAGADKCCNFGSGCPSSCKLNVMFSRDAGATFSVIGQLSDSSLGFSLTWGINTQRDYIYWVNQNNILMLTTDFGTTIYQVDNNRLLFFYYDEVNQALGFITDSIKFTGTPLTFFFSSTNEPYSNLSFSGKVLPLLASDIDLNGVVIEDFHLGTFYVIAYTETTIYVPSPVDLSIIPCNLLVANADRASDFTRGLQNIVSNAQTGLYDFVSLVPIANADPRGIAIANIFNSTLNRISSRITFNAAVSWLPLRANECGSNTSCSLHFFGPASGVFSLRKQFPTGMSIVLGNRGSFQNRFDSTFGLYMTRDFGQTWFNIMIIDGSITKEVAYDIDASGNALVVIRSNEPTTVYTSYDFGATWSSCNLTDPALDEAGNITWSFGNIYSEETFGGNYEIGNTVSTSFYVTARFTNRTTQAIGDALFRYNIVSLQGIRDCNSSDYELFSLPLSPTACILGKRYAFNRKRISSDCQINQSVIASFVEVPGCDCDLSQDYYCGLCLIKNPARLNLVCMPDDYYPFCATYNPANMPTILARGEPVCTPFDSYTYIKLQDDGCVYNPLRYPNLPAGPVDAPTRWYCPADNSALIYGLVFGLVFGLALLVLIAVLIFSKYMEKKPEIDQAVKENIQEVAVTVMANENDIERH